MQATATAPATSMKKKMPDVEENPFAGDILLRFKHRPKVFETSKLEPAETAVLIHMRKIRRVLCAIGASSDVRTET